MTRKSILLPVRGPLLVFVTYFYFLLFSQFTFLELMESAFSRPIALKGIMAVMALSGITGSVLAVRLRRLIHSGNAFPALILGCSILAFISPFLGGSLVFAMVAAAMGLVMGSLTVSVAAMLPVLMPGSHRGLLTGMATGLAYLVSNLPFVFTASPSARALICAVVPALAAVFLWVTPGMPSRIDSPPKEGWTRWRLVLVVIVLGALVWFDSAFFFLLQQTRELKSVSWQGTPQLLVNAGLHLAVAVASGLILDRGRARLVLALAWLGLSAGAIGLQQGGLQVFTAFYVAGVSLYSVALVYIPSLHFREAGDHGSFVRAAVVFSIAGWIASGMGIGMADGLSRIPVAFIVIGTIAMLPLAKLSRFFQ